MEMYLYQGRNKHGESMQGMVESNSPHAVAQWLMETGIFPISITPQLAPSSDPAWFQRLKRGGGVTQRELLLFTRQMTNMVRAGLPMLDSIAGIRKSVTNRAMIKVLQALRDDLDKGSDLSVALARHPKVFGDYYVSMIRVGETSGRLQDAFHALSEQIEFDRQMRQKIKSALRYPTFVLTAIAIALAILTLFVLPTFSSIYAGMHVNLPVLTRVLLGISNFAVNYWWIVLILGGVAFYAIQLFIRNAEGLYLWDKYKLRLPILGPILARATMARYCRSFATASRAGVPIVQNFQLVSRVVDNAFYEDRILQMRHGVERGEILSRVMRTSGLFSPLELQMISVAEQTGEVDNAIEQMALMYREEVEYDVSRLSQTIEPLLLAGLGALVGILLLGIFLPLWELGQATFQNMRR